MVNNTKSTLARQRTDGWSRSRLSIVDHIKPSACRIPSSHRSPSKWLELDPKLFGLLFHLSVSALHSANAGQLNVRMAVRVRIQIRLLDWQRATSQLAYDSWNKCPFCTLNGPLGPYESKASRPTVTSRQATCKS